MQTAFFQKDEARDDQGRWTGGDGGGSGAWSQSNKHFAHVATASGKTKMSATPSGKVPVKTGPHPDHATAVNALRHKFPAETKGQSVTSGWGLDGAHNDIRWTKHDEVAKSDGVEAFLIGMK